jgi:hypothetical protein
MFGRSPRRNSAPSHFVNRRLTFRRHSLPINETVFRTPLLVRLSQKRRFAFPEDQDSVCLEKRSLRSTSCEVFGLELCEKSIWSYVRPAQVGKLPRGKGNPLQTKHTLHLLNDPSGLVSGS